MKKLLLFVFTLVLMSASDCEGRKEEFVYLVIDKDKSVGSHFNPLHKDGFEVGTDYYMTLKNTTTGNVFVHETSNAKLFYLYEKGKKYRHERFWDDYKK